MSNNLKSIGILAAAALVLAGCNSTQSESEATATPASTTQAAEAEATSPETSEAPAPESKYERIVAINAEASDMALLLAGPENMAAVATSSQSPLMGQVPELARQVEETIPSGIEPDAEQILSFDPDLVLITTRHDTENTVLEQLEAAGVTTVAFDGSEYNTPEDYAATLRELGETLGLETKADALATELETEIAALDKTKGDASPSFVALMARGQSVMVMGENNALPGLAMRAGATNAAADIGLSKTSPIDAEQLLKANPEIIFVEDFNGAGFDPFQDMLSNPALAEVDAIKNDRVVLIPGMLKPRPSQASTCRPDTRKFWPK